MKIIGSIVLLLVSTSLASASPSQAAPKVNIDKVDAQAAYIKSTELYEIFSLCNKNLSVLENELAPTKSNIDALTNYFEKREHFNVSSIEPGSWLRPVFDSRENNGLYDYANKKRILITELLGFCDGAMHAAYDELLANNAVKLAVVNNQGLLDATVEIDARSKEALDAENGLFKANNKDGAWRLTNSYDRIVTYEMMYESGSKMIVMIKKPGKEYQLGSTLPEGYYRLHGSHPFDVEKQGHTEERDILIFEQVSVVE